MAMTYPALSFQMAPGIASTVTPGPGDWVDFTARLASVSTKTGRDDEFAQPGAGTLTIILKNSDGVLDPDNASGIYYGQLKAKMWVRLLGGTTTANVDAFYGQVTIDGFKVSASQFPDQYVTIDVVDQSEHLANVELQSSVWEYTMRQQAPLSWWRLGEKNGTTMVDSSGNGHDGTYEGGATFNSTTGLVALDADAAINFNVQAMQGVVPIGPTGTPGAAITAFPFAVTGWFVLPAANQGRVMWSQRAASGGNSYMAVQASGTGGLADSIFTGIVDVDGSNKRTWQTSATFADGKAHFLAVNWYADGSVDVWVDAVYQTVSLFSTAGAAPGIQSPAGVQYVAASSTLSATFDEVATFNRQLISTDVQALYAAGTAPWEGDTPGARAAKILAAVGYTGATDLDAGSTTLQAATLATNPLASLQDVAKAERGELYINHQDGGKLRLRARTARWTAAASTVSQATFGDGGGTEIPYVAADRQDDRIINRATVGRANGANILVVDASSESQYDERSYSETGLIYETDAESTYRASAIVSEKKARRPRVRSITLAPRAATHPAWAQVFARQIGDRITVKWRPPYGGTYTFGCYIEGIRHTWTPRAGLTTVFSLSPTPLVDYLVLDSPTLGLLDTARLAF